MTAIDFREYHHRMLPRGLPPMTIIAFYKTALEHRVHAAFSTARFTVAEWRRRVRVRNELLTLSDGDLRDIRWTRAEVEAEGRKPFWQG